MSMKKLETRQLVLLGVLAAIAYALVFLCRIPVVAFLSYEPKDVVITIGGLIYGPMAAMIISVIVSFVEMITMSDTGIWGLIMNILSTCAFACTAAWIYKKKRNMQGAVIGMVAGCILMVVVMLLWNYLITPLYMTGTSRSDIAGMLVPVFLPFNLVKGIICSVLAMLLYKRVSKILHI